MTTKTTGLILLFLMSGTVIAQKPPEVTPLMSRDLTESPGRDVLMITVEYDPGGADPVPVE